MLQRTTNIYCIPSSHMTSVSCTHNYYCKAWMISNTMLSTLALLLLSKTSSFELIKPIWQETSQPLQHRHIETISAGLPTQTYTNFWLRSDSPIALGTRKISSSLAIFIHKSLAQLTGEINILMDWLLILIGEAMEAETQFLFILTGSKWWAETMQIMRRLILIFDYNFNKMPIHLSRFLIFVVQAEKL